jgi:hypothetical protein
MTWEWGASVAEFAGIRAHRECGFFLGPQNFGVGRQEVNVMPAPASFQRDVCPGPPPEHVADTTDLVDRHGRFPPTLTNPGLEPCHALSRAT